MGEFAGEFVEEDVEERLVKKKKGIRKKGMSAVVGRYPLCLCGVRG